MTTNKLGSDVVIDATKERRDDQKGGVDPLGASDSMVSKFEFSGRKPDVRLGKTVNNANC